jgi:polyamine oxidase
MIASLLSVGCAAVATSSAAPLADADVLVLGAGLAGAAAAAVLINQSNASLRVVMMDASSRIGGRVQAVTFGSPDVRLMMIERGANWIQGMRLDCTQRDVEHVNPMWEMKCASGLNGSLIPGSEQEVRGLPVIVDNGTLLTNLTSERLAQRERDIAAAEDCAMGNATSYNATTSVLEGLHNCGWVDQDLVDVSLRWKATDSDYAVPAAVASILLSSLDDTYTLFGPDDWLVTDQNEYGFAKFVHEIIAPLQAQHPDTFQLQLNTTVTRIDYSNPSAVVVYTADGAHMSAKHVIVTFSAGVIRHDHETLFVPALSDVQASAVEAIPMANFTKVFVQFPEVWWPNAFKCSLLATECSASSENDGMFPWHNLEHVDILPGSKTLFTVVTGPLAGVLDLMSDEELQQVVMQRLRCSFPQVRRMHALQPFPHCQPTGDVVSCVVRQPGTSQSRLYARLSGRSAFRVH